MGKANSRWKWRWIRQTPAENSEKDRYEIKELLDVDRPANNRGGRQLNLLVSWEGTDPQTGREWPNQWINITGATSDLKAKARIMEREKYPTEVARPKAPGAAPLGMPGESRLKLTPELEEPRPRRSTRKKQSVGGQ